MLSVRNALLKYRHRVQLRDGKKETLSGYINIKQSRFQNKEYYQNTEDHLIKIIQRTQHS